MKIRALNEPDIEESSSDQSSNDEKREQKLSKEALEEQYFDRYKNALIAIQEKRRDEALDALEELNDEFDDIDTSSESLQQLRFSVLKNLGNLDDDNIDHFIEALSIDSTDINLWMKAGDRSAKMKNLVLARYCYEQALVINPENWLAIDRLMEIYYISHLPFELYDLCSRALRINPGNQKAGALLFEAKNMQPSLEDPSIKFGGSLQLGGDAANVCDNKTISSLNYIKQKRRHEMENDQQKCKKARLSLLMDNSKTQSLESFGNYIVKFYERYSRQGITSNSLIDLTISTTEEASRVYESDRKRITRAYIKTLADRSNDKTLLDTQFNDIDDQFDDSLEVIKKLAPKSGNEIGDRETNQLSQIIKSAKIWQSLDLLNQRSDSNSDSKDDESFVGETNSEPMKEHHLVIKDIIESLIGPGSTAKSDIKFCDMIYLYLSKVASNKQNNLPEPFTKLYKIYRKLCPLTTSVFVEFGPRGLTTDEIWFTLTANETSYQKSECSFLLRVLDLLQLKLDDLQHKEFLVRLFLILGLNNDSRYLQLALEAIEEGTRIYASDRKIITRAYIKTLIDKTSENIHHDAPMDVDAEENHDSLELLMRLAKKSENEISDREIKLLCQAILSNRLWQKGLDILNQRNDLNSEAILDTINICLKNGGKMDAALAGKLCKEALTNVRPKTWTCLYRGWCSVMDPDELEDEDTLENMSQFFELGHQALGKKCSCTVDQGEFLMLYVKHLLHKNVDCEEKVIHGTLSCLFNFPNKKPTFVAGHKATRVPIIWEYAEILYPYFEADELPTYMSLLRKVGISGETEPILAEIANSVPESFSPLSRVSIIEEFIRSGKVFSEIPVIPHNVTKNVYYYLADYYFKMKEFEKAKKYYHYDLVINPERFDSWAASSLIRANEIDTALSDGTLTTSDFVDGPFKQLVDSAVRCFDQATTLNPTEAKATLWVEFGNLTYSLVSLASRLYTYDDSEARLNRTEIPDMSLLQSRYNHLYLVAKNCFKSANTLCHSEEVWLHYYMLGKIKGKLDPLSALSYYIHADSQLFHEGASYPKRISYKNTPDLAYEAMEVHYRIHSCALKYLFTHRELSQDKLNCIKKYLLHAQRSPFVQMESLPNPKKNMFKTLEKDVSLLLNDIIDSMTNDATYDELVFMCLHGLKRCLVRCDKNFKALYRLAYYYFQINDVKMAQNVLLGKEIVSDHRINVLREKNPNTPEFMVAPPDLKGVNSLFKDRKVGNLFFNIWRIPVEEVDRPGCFEHWMFKCTVLLIEICKILNDTPTLNMIAFQLNRQPDMSKKYLQDRARILLARLASQPLNNAHLDVQ